MLLTFPSVVLDVLAEAPAVSIVRGFGFFRIWLGYNTGSEVVFSNSSLPLKGHVRAFLSGHWRRPQSD